MELTKKQSDRLNDKGEHYTDLFVKWSYNGKEYQVRVKPCFAKDFKLLVSVAKDTQQ